jgi:hypothetical protein
MPNWSENSLTIIGPHEQLEAFLAKAEDEKHQSLLSLQRLLPIPEELDVPVTSNELDPRSADEQELARREENVRKYGSSDSFAWRVANWGTKWDLCDVTRSEVLPPAEHGWDSCINFRFSSAWSPAVPAFADLSKEFGLIFVVTYYLIDENFGGSIVFIRGDAIQISARHDLFEFEDGLDAEGSEAVASVTDPAQIGAFHDDILF